MRHVSLALQFLQSSLLLEPSKADICLLYNRVAIIDLWGKDPLRYPWESDNFGVSV